jgi:hypothetical protein
MDWPYHLLDLSDEQKHERRILLDRYGVYAQLSALVPILVYQLYRLGVWVCSERQRSKVAYSAVPSSPTLKQSRHSTSSAIVRKWRSTVWWLESEIAPGWGLREHWIAAGCWTSWLLFLCTHKTGDGTLPFFSVRLLGAWFELPCTLFVTSRFLQFKVHRLPSISRDPTSLPAWERSALHMR